MPKTIGVCGFMYSGSSAVFDFLKEFEENDALEEVEFGLSVLPDGLEDLYYHLNTGFSETIKSIVSIERYRRLCNNSYLNQLKKATKYKLSSLTEDYINKITQTTWRGAICSDIYIYPFSRWLKTNKLLKIPRSISNRMFKYAFNRMFSHTYACSVNPDDFIKITKEYMNNVLISAGLDMKKNIILDQAFSPYNPKAGFDFYNNPKVILVKRDPRDQYIFGKLFLGKKYLNLFPTENVLEYIKYYKCVIASNQCQDDFEILNISFEDMIFKYIETTQKIMDFIGLKKHDFPNRNFDPSLSINNTQLYKRYPQYREDIKYIESELSEFLYNFDGCPEPNLNENIF